MKLILYGGKGFRNGYLRVMDTFRQRPTLPIAVSRIYRNLEDIFNIYRLLHFFFFLIPSYIKLILLSIA